MYLILDLVFIMTIKKKRELFFQKKKKKKLGIVTVHYTLNGIKYPSI